RSLFKKDQALQLKFSADPRMWAWCLRFLQNCNAESFRTNTVRKLKLCVYSQQRLQALVAETGIAYDGIKKGLLYVYRDGAALERGIANMKILRDQGQTMETLDAAAIAKLEPAFEGSRAPIAGGLYCPADESGDANIFTIALAERAKTELGVKFQFGTTITGF